MSVEELRVVLRKEIAFHKTKLGSSEYGKDWEEGFIEGMEHVDAIIENHFIARRQQEPPPMQRST